MEDGSMKHAATVITLSRIPLALVMALSVPFSLLFWISYALGGLSDLLDGPVARRLQRQSDAGARLDSIADAVFALAISVSLLRAIRLPAWLWALTGLVFLLRGASYLIGFRKYHTFPALHTRLNKLTGAGLFLLPLLHWLVGISVAGGILGGLALLSAAEELAITLRAETLDRDRKGLFG